VLLRRPDIPGWSVVLGSSSSPPAPSKRLVDPQHPLLSDKELIVEVLRQNPGLTVEEILAEAKFHGWDLDPTGVQLLPNTPTPRSLTHVCSADVAFTACSGLKACSNAAPSSLAAVGLYRPPSPSYR